MTIEVCAQLCESAGHETLGSCLLRSLTLSLMNMQRSHSCLNCTPGRMSSAKQLSKSSATFSPRVSVSKVALATAVNAARPAELPVLY